MPGEIMFPLVLLIVGRSFWMAGRMPNERTSDQLLASLF